LSKKARGRSIKEESLEYSGESKKREKKKKKGKGIQHRNEKMLI
jgi:hypothetical protein